MKLKKVVLFNLFIQADINVVKSIHELVVKELEITEISLFYFNRFIAFFSNYKANVNFWVESPG